MEKAMQQVVEAQEPMQILLHAQAGMNKCHDGARSTMACSHAIAYALTPSRVYFYQISSLQETLLELFGNLLLAWETTSWGPMTPRMYNRKAKSANLADCIPHTQVMHKPRRLCLSYTGHARTNPHAHRHPGASLPSSLNGACSTCACQIDTWQNLIRPLPGHPGMCQSCQRLFIYSQVKLLPLPFHLCRTSRTSCVPTQ